MALSSGSRGLGKRIVRNVGGDLLPLEALRALKPRTPYSNEIVNDSSLESQRNTDRSIFANRHIHFRNNPTKPNRTWKPNLKLKRLFVYLHDHEIEPKITIHSIKSVERSGGIDKYLIKTPYYKSETKMGLMWKGRIEKKYVELRNKEVGFFTSEDEVKIAEALKELNLNAVKEVGSFSQSKNKSARKWG